jgi:hypothetical protein
MLWVLELRVPMLKKWIKRKDTRIVKLYEEPSFKSLFLQYLMCAENMQLGLGAIEHEWSSCMFGEIQLCSSCWRSREQMRRGCVRKV